MEAPKRPQIRSTGLVLGKCRQSNVPTSRAAVSTCPYAANTMSQNESEYEPLKETCMKQLTVRGFDEELSASLRSLAEREGTSLNQAALKLLRKGAGLADEARGTDIIGSALDHLIGTWTPSESDEMDSALREFETMDESAWQ